MGTLTNTAFGCPRDFNGNEFVYTVISARARGLSLGINLNPDQHCNFDCAYCEVIRETSPRNRQFNITRMVEELQEMLGSVRSGRIRERSFYGNLPQNLLELRHVALSGDGEPTLCPCFTEAVEAVIHLRARGMFQFFKLVLITNGSGLDLPGVQSGLRYFSARDEIWIKLDGGTQEYLDLLNKPDCPIEKTMANILVVARERPVVIQSLFPSLYGEGPSGAEIEAYVHRLQELKNAGAQIALVQIYSASRPTSHPECGHLPLRSLSAIAKRVRESTGLKTDVC